MSFSSKSDSSPITRNAPKHINKNEDHDTKKCITLMLFVVRDTLLVAIGSFDPDQFSCVVQIFLSFLPAIFGFFIFKIDLTIPQCEPATEIFEVIFFRFFGAIFLRSWNHGMVSLSSAIMDCSRSA